MYAPSQLQFKKRYNVKLSLIGWAHSQNDPCIGGTVQSGKLCFHISNLCIGLPIYLYKNKLILPVWSLENSGKTML